MAMAIDYCPSPPDLASQVIGFVSRQDDTAAGRALELPLLNPLIQFFLDGQYRVRPVATDQPFRRTPGTGLWGPARDVWEGEHDGRMDAFVIILSNRGLAALCGQMPRDLAGLRLDCSSLWPTVDSLADRLVNTISFSQRVDLAVAWLRGLPRVRNNVSQGVLASADHMLQGQLRGPVEHLCARIGIAPRALRKQFESTLGCSPKYVLRAARLQRALRQLHPQPWAGERQDDARLEYFDESHFIRDFMQLTTLSPGQYRARKILAGDPLVNTVY